ncbi:MAG: DUF4412 domain-containing protein, partial [Bacteroidia bacterium]|nr:DUF4412 domain-containing protein [Bacteroidia bacterium]
MKRIATTLFTAFLLISGLSAQSIADRLARKMEQVAEQKAGEKIGQKLEEKFGKAMEDLYNMGDSSGTTIRVEDDRVIMTDENGDEVELTTEADDTQPSEVIASEFIGSFVMETTEYKGGKVKKDFPMSIHYFIDSYNLAFQVENKEEAAQSIMIFDRRSRKVTTKMIDEDGNKTAMIMPMMRVKAKVKSEDVESSEFSVTATGKTKTIEGFLCKEYQIETEEESATAWVTEEWDFNYAIL